MPVQYPLRNGLTSMIVTAALALSSGFSAAEGMAGSAQSATPAAQHTSAQKKSVHKMHKWKVSAEIKQVQEALNKNGASLKVDGMMGRSTKMALKSYQKSKGLPETGHLDPKTRKMLLGT